MDSASLPDPEEVELIAPLSRFWERWRYVLQPVLFLGGVVFDYLTLQLHQTFDQLFIVGCLAALVFAYGLEMRLARGRVVPAWLARRASLIGLLDAMVLGALLSSLAIAVVRAVYPGPTVVFVALLFGMAIANEAEVPALRGDLTRFGLVGFFGYQVGRMLAPFALGRLVGPEWGVGVAAVAVLALLLIVELGPTLGPRIVRDHVLSPLAASVGGVALLVVLEALRVVPPLPVVLRETVVAHDVDRVDGRIRFEDPAPVRALSGFLNRPAALTWSEGETVAVFTAIYAPPAVELTTRACWDSWQDGAWAEVDCIEQPVEGGRVHGWRTWTRKESVWRGDWRVRLQLEDGREIGRVRFRLIAPSG